MAESVNGHRQGLDNSAQAENMAKVHYLFSADVKAVIYPSSTVAQPLSVGLTAS